VADYFEAARGRAATPRLSNWVMTEVMRKLKEGGRGRLEPGLPAALAGLVRLIDAGTISGKIEGRVREDVGDGEPAADRRARGPDQLSDDFRARSIVAEVVAAFPEQAASYRGGKDAALGCFVGQVMKRTGGRATHSGSTSCSAGPSSPRRDGAEGPPPGRGDAEPAGEGGLVVQRMYVRYPPDVVISTQERLR